MIICFVLKRLLFIETLERFSFVLVFTHVWCDIRLFVICYSFLFAFGYVMN